MSYDDSTYEYLSTTILSKALQYERVRITTADAAKAKSKKRSSSYYRVNDDSASVESESGDSYVPSKKTKASEKRPGDISDLDHRSTRSVSTISIPCFTGGRWYDREDRFSRTSVSTSTPVRQSSRLKTGKPTNYSVESGFEGSIASHNESFVSVGEQGTDIAEDIVPSTSFDPFQVASREVNEIPEKDEVTHPQITEDDVEDGEEIPEEEIQDEEIQDEEIQEEEIQEEDIPEEEQDADGEEEEVVADGNEEDDSEATRDAEEKEKVSKDNCETENQVEKPTDSGADLTSVDENKEDREIPMTQKTPEIESSRLVSEPSEADVKLLAELQAKYGPSLLEKLQRTDKPKQQ